MLTRQYSNTVYIYMNSLTFLVITEISSGHCIFSFLGENQLLPTWHSEDINVALVYKLPPKISGYFVVCLYPLLTCTKIHYFPPEYQINGKSEPSISLWKLYPYNNDQATLYSTSLSIFCPSFQNAFNL